MESINLKESEKIIKYINAPQLMPNAGDDNNYNSSDFVRKNPLIIFHNYKNLHHLNLSELAETKNHFNVILHLRNDGYNYPKYEIKIYAFCDCPKYEIKIYACYNCLNVIFKIMKSKFMQVAIIQNMKSKFMHVTVAQNY